MRGLNGIEQKDSLGIVAVDVDEVIANLLEEWLKRYNRDFSDNLTIEKITKWDITKFVKKECGDQIFKYLYEDDIYDFVQPIPGAIAGIKYLRNEGLRVIFATSCVKGMSDKKVEWLVRHELLDKNNRTQLDFIAATDKSLVNADILVDDRCKNIMMFNARNKYTNKGILFDAPYNKNCSKALRANDWNEVVRFIGFIFGRYYDLHSWNAA